MGIFSYILIVVFFFTTSCGLNQRQKEEAMTNRSTQLDQLKQMAAYNSWANQQFTEWLIQADTSQWNRQMESSFNTLDLTLRHIWNAKHGWLTTLKRKPWSNAIENNQILDKDTLLSKFIITTLEFESFVASINEEELYDVRKIGKDQKEISIADIILHVFNHATYHRGQLITMGRKVGLTLPPRTDYIYFLMKD